MTYGLIYTIPFASLQNNACVVEIEKEDYTGVTLELTGAESPFEVDVDDDDFLYVPTRFSTARIRVIGSDYLQQLYSTSYQQYRVTFKRNGVVTWCGFVKPELYTQDYSSENFELEIECMSAMSVLEFVNYKQSGTDGKEFVSLLDLMKKCVDSSRGQYSAIYIPKVYALSESDYNSGKSNVLGEMTVSEQDFFDEDDKPMKLKEVLEEICKLLNWTCCDWKGKLYFIDIDHSGNYYHYSGYPSWDVYMTVTQGAVSNVQKIGFAGSDHSLDRLNGWNKVTVKTSNYPVGNLLPDEDFDELTVAAHPNDVSEEKKVSRKIVMLPSMWDMKQYIENTDIYGGLELAGRQWVQEHKDKANMLMGALPIRFCEYNLNDDWTPSITSYNYEDAIQIRWTTKEPPETLSINMSSKPVIVIKGEAATYSDGAFAISGDLRFCLNREMGVIGGTYNWYANPKLYCTLRIGKYWYNGSGWVYTPVMPEIPDFIKRYFLVEFKRSEGETTWFGVKDTKTLDMPYNGLTGFVIPLDRSISGDLELTIYGSSVEATVPVQNITVYGIFLKGLKFSYQKKDGDQKEDSNSDRYYENIVNEDYINELDEIEFKISSYNNDGACYSKVLLGDNYLTDNLYSAISEKLIRPEEHLIQRIVNRYSATRIKLTQVIQETPELTPLTRLSDNSAIGSIFTIAGGSIDYKMGQFKCVMVEV